MSIQMVTISFALSIFIEITLYSFQCKAQYQGSLNTL